MMTPKFLPYPNGIQLQKGKQRHLRSALVDRTCLIHRGSCKLFSNCSTNNILLCNKDHRINSALMILDHEASNHTLSPKVQAASPIKPSSTPRPNSIQIPQPAQVTPIGDPRPTTRSSRSVDHGPMGLDLCPRTTVQGSGQVAGKVLIVDLQGRIAKLVI